MKVDLFDFELPKSRIALRPVSPRDSARLLVVRDGTMKDQVVRDLPEFLAPGDVMVFNDTRVIPARLIGRKGEGKVEVTLHLRETDRRWRAFARPAKKLGPGVTITFEGALTATVIARGEAGEVTLDFDSGDIPFGEALTEAGIMPLPPYIASQRPPDDRDLADYQTVYADREGAVAAPTAGLHFTDRLLHAIDAHGIGRATVTLHVGAGTFLPVKVDDTADHKMHSEWGEISAETAEALNAARQAGGRIVAVGTTAMRLLESAADDDGRIQPFVGTTDIFITPGYRFKAVDVLMTNFHLPRSTLFMLVSAFAGLETMRKAYDHAIGAEYRFYSYGDSSLLFRVAS